MIGFRYNGVHCNDMKVTWTPDEKEIGDFFSDFDVIDNERAWMSGGTYIKSRTKSREFTLTCFYDSVTYAERERIIAWLDRRTQGELVYDMRPYAVYYVHPSKVISVKDYWQEKFGTMLYSGTFSVQFTAYYPFARLIYNTLDECPEDSHALDECGLISADMMPAVVDVEDSEFLVYNPGTETGNSIIRFEGSTGSDELVIYNATTGNRFGLRAGLSTQENEYIEANSLTGRVMLKNDVLGTENISFAYHDYGYITFAPFAPAAKGVVVNTTSGSRTVTSYTFVFTPDMVGRYIYLDEDWRYIGQYISPTSINLNVNAQSTTTAVTNIVVMNYLTIEKAEDADIQRLEVICKPEVR